MIDSRPRVTGGDCVLALALKHGAVMMIAIGLIASIAASEANAGSRVRPSCLPRRAHAVAEDQDVRVYSLKAPFFIRGHRYVHEVTFACLLRDGATLKLTDSKTHSPASNSRVALNGPMVAYTYSIVGVDTGQTEIVTANVASHRTLLTVPNAADFTDACVISFREIKSLVVTDHGSVAWILRKGHGCRTETFQVYDASSSSDPTLLEEGLSIDPRSLRVSRKAVSWENSGARHYARLA